MELSLNAYGKINLGLDVVRRREDGYHEVKMIMQTVDLYDRMEFRDIDDERVIIESDSGEMPETCDNIIYKAYMLLKEEFNIPGGMHSGSCGYGRRKCGCCRHTDRSEQNI